MKNLITPPMVPLTAIDEWPIAESGLPTRVVNAARKGGLRKAGEVRALSDAEVLDLHHLGRVSLAQTRRFFALAKAIASGRQRFRNLEELLRCFLEADQRHVIRLRFALARNKDGSRSEPATLQTIGSADGRTRERIRQVEEVGLERLGKRMVQVCLDPVFVYFEDRLRSLNGSAPVGELEGLLDAPWMGALDPVGVLRLLSSIRPDRIGCTKGIYSLWSPERLAGFEQKLLDAMGKAKRPQPVGRFLPPGSGPAEERAALLLLARNPQAGMLLDGRCFLFTATGEHFLDEVLSDLGDTASFRKLMLAANERLQPTSRRTRGFYRSLLRKARRFTRARRNVCRG